MVSVAKDLTHEPYSHEPQLEDSLHLAQIVLLLTCLEWWWRDRDDFFAAGNLSIYYPRPKPFARRYTGPDFFVVRDTVRRPRRSWVVENEGKYPNVIVEILSPSTAKRDRTVKKDLYQDVFQTPEYFWFYPRSKKLEFKGFRLQNGRYVEIVPNAQGRLWSEQLELYLGVVDGNLRYFTSEGMMVPNFEEATAQERQRAEQERQRAEQEHQRAEQEHQRAEQEHQRAEQERQRAEQEHQRAEQEHQRAEQERLHTEEAEREVDRLREFLRSQGIDPDQLQS
jgi:Uma2 family endonuclease